MGRPWGRVAQQRADRLGRLGREDVLQLAGLVLHGRLGDRQQVPEEPLGEPVPPHHVAGARLAGGGEAHAGAVEQEQAVGGQGLEVGASRVGGVGRRGARQDRRDLVAPPLALGEDGLEQLLEPA
jgi:hypothetical protein